MMNCEELIETSNERKVEIYLHLPEYEGQKLLLVGGAVTTYDLFVNHFFDDSLCHLYKDGRLLRYGRVIGSFADIEVLNIIEAGNVTTVTARAKPAVRTAKNQKWVGSSKAIIFAPTDEGIVEIRGRDEIDHALSLAAVAAKVTQAKKSLSTGGRAAPYVERVLRYCWTAALSPKEISEGLGIMDDATKGRISTACNAVEKVGLMIKDENGRYRVNQDEIQRLKTLSQLRK